MMAPYGTFKTKDGYKNIAAGNQDLKEGSGRAPAGYFS